MDSNNKRKSLENVEQNLKNGQPSQNRGSIWSRINSLHSSEETRGLIPLEAFAMQPFAAGSSGEQFILALICVKQEVSENNMLFPPCGCVIWSYPDWKLVNYIDIKNTFSEKTPAPGEEAVAAKADCDKLENYLQGNSKITPSANPLENIYVGIVEKYLSTPIDETLESSSFLSNESENSATELFNLMNDTKKIIDELKTDLLLNEWKNIYRKMHTSGFTVAVVGEFSRGKSTLINKLLANDILPVSNLPTTAMLTKIGHSSQNSIEHLQSNGKSQLLPLESSSWDNLTINLFEEGPEGVMRVNLQNEWLKKTGLQIIDTPGAGDLGEKRFALVNDAIVGCDGAVIVVDATMALSLTEKAFIEQHIIAKKVPHIMVVVTKMDQIPKKERTNVIDYVITKLNLWGVNVPVYIPQENMIPDEKQYENMAGIDKIKEAIEKWIADSRHIKLKNISICVQLQDLLHTAEKMLEEEKTAMQMSSDEKLKALKEQENQIEQLGLRWEEYRLEMLKRCNACTDWMRQVVEEKEVAIIERLQFELLHTQNPKSWWQTDLPYRLKQEMSAVAQNMENNLNHRFLQDLKWLNQVIAKDFSSSIGVDQAAVDKTVELPDGLSNMDVKDTNKIRMFVRFGAGTASIMGYILFGPFGIAASVGGGIISEILMGKSIEKQKEELQKLVGIVVKQGFRTALEASEKRIEGFYDKAVHEAVKQEQIWLRTQKNVLMKSGSTDKDVIHRLDNKLHAVHEIIHKINIFMEVQ